MHLRYTLCFLQRNDEVLLLYRLREPNRHRWNGVGGKLQPGETPRQSCIREILEETGLTVGRLDFRGILTWNESEGLYLFTASDWEGELTASEEGPLEWKPLNWMLESDQTVSNIPLFFPVMMRSPVPLEHAFVYDENGLILAYEPRPLRHGVDPDIPLEVAANQLG